MKAATQTVDYGEYTANEEKVREFCKEIERIFDQFVSQLSEKYDEENFRQIEFGLEPLDLTLLKRIYLDTNRLQRAVMSAFIDICRYAEFHELFDDSHVPPRLDICEHKKGGFLTRWFIRFCPAIIPLPVAAAADSFHLKRYGALELLKAEDDLDPKIKTAAVDELEKAAHRAWELLDLVTRLNEYFILHFVLHAVMAIPIHEDVFFTQVEKRDLVYHLTYRAGHLQGSDWSLLFHWIQQGLSARPTRAYALCQGLENIELSDRPEELRATYEELTRQMDEANRLLPDPDEELKARLRNS